MPFIKPEIVEKVFEASDLVEVIKDFVELKKSGSTWKGLSPFVDEKSGSFMVSPAKSIWKCFSSGKGGSNAISFLMAKMSLSFPDAVEYLAKKYAIEVQYDDSEWTKEYHQKEERRQDLRPLLESVIRKFEEEFEKLPEDHPAKLEVFKKREYTAEIVEEYRIGYAPGGTFIYDLCSKVGRVNDAIALGLISETHSKDKWHDRVIFPLIDRKGASLVPVGLAGRKLSDSKKYAKWMNSTDSELYKKDEFWYGLDKAREEITKRGEAWLVEGYNDVIAWQTNGIPNTIASCGTSIASKQIRLLKKFCDKVIFCMDPDAAGKKSMLKYIPEFIRLGFRVQTAVLKENLDPDDYVRLHKRSDFSYSIEDLGTDVKFRKDGFQFLMQEKFAGKDEVAIAQEAKELTSLISKIEDEAIKTIYIEWLAKESKVKKPQINSWLKGTEERAEKLLTSEDDLFYRLPEVVKEPLDKLRPTIEKYQLFQANSQIWMQLGDTPPYHFRSVSNFSIEIIQHMQDEKFPMKLVRIRNVHGDERIFDMQSSEMNTPQQFETAVTNHGNFRWKGNRNQHELLKTYLFDKMGTGRKVEVLGWQPEGFWVWNNLITVPGKEQITIDENGVFNFEKVCYYVPSANQIYRNNIYKFEAQKKVSFLRPKINFTNYAAQVIKVHREHGLMGILFSISSMFQDIVVSELNFFPILFFFGQPSSGKDQLADVCQSFFGAPQTAINLEGGVSTMKAQVREFAQFCNMISQLSEYKPGDPKLNGLLKGLWDRRGYKRGTIDSHVGTESIPILSAVLMTANYFPDDEALITRLVCEFMDKNTFTDSETKEYEKLADMTKKGISGFTEEFLQHRAVIKNNFKAKYREFKATLGQRKPEANSRMISNIAVFGTFYQILQNEISFPFSFDQMLTHFDKTIDSQMNKLSGASIINRWWDCFLASMRGTLADQIRVNRDFKIESDRLYFNFTSCYNRVSRQWYSQYRDSSPDKTSMSESLKKESSWIGTIKGTRMAPGKDSRVTSAFIVNLNEIPVADEIKFAIDFQLNENSLFDQGNGSGNIFSSPATPENQKNDESKDDLPF